MLTKLAIRRFLSQYKHKSLFLNNKKPLRARISQFLLPTGRWQLQQNGQLGTLNITSVINGNVTGNIVAAGRTDPIQGFYNFSEGRILFIRIINVNNPSQNQIFEGWIQRRSNTDVFFTLTGYFIAFAGAGGSATKNKFSWFATTTRVG